MIKLKKSEHVVKSSSILIFVFVIAFCILSYILNLTGMISDSKIMMLMLWMTVINICFALYISERHTLYGRFILFLHLFKSGILILLVMKYTCDLDLGGYLIGDAYRFAGTARARYGGSSLVDSNLPVVAEKIYRITGENAALFVFFNICIMTIGMIVFAAIINMLGIRPGIGRDMSMIVMSLNPYALYASINFIREPIETVCPLLGLYFFFRWWQCRNIRDIYIALIWTIPALYMHSGYVMYPVVFIISYILIRAENVTERIKKTISIVVVIVAMCIIVPNIMNDKFGISDYSLSGVFLTLKNRYKYLEWLGGQSSYMKDVRLYTYMDLPRVLAMSVYYFLLSPTPSYWRGIVDVGVFFFDSLWIVIGIAGAVFCLLFYRGRDTKRLKSKLLVILSIALSTALIFSVGTSTAGTAIRHRNTIMPLFALCMAIAFNRSKRYKEPELGVENVSEI